VSRGEVIAAARALGVNAGGSCRDLAHAFVRSTTALVNVSGYGGRLLLANPALQAFTGLGEEEMLGRPFWEVFVIPEDVPRAREAVERAMAGGLDFPEEGDWMAAGGVIRRIAMQNSVLLDGDGHPFAVACVGIDVTEDRRAAALLGERVSIDPLTGVRNRSALFQALRQHLDPLCGSGCGLLFCDLDWFKEVNDRHGHAVGDRLLTEVAARLVEATGPDDVVARFGGDEFVVLCPGADRVALEELAARLEATMREPLQLPSGPLSIGASIGSALGRPGEDPDELIARADHHMYDVKAHRRIRRR
jgi:diguanylate cyclase (GGDEF)-like protein/PAS domain S-box-containing protein